MTAWWLTGDTRAVMAELPAGSVDLCLFSPPFLALRSYLPDDDPAKVDEIGSEANPAEFIDTLLDVTEACARLLAPHGSLCVELGDTYSGSGGAGGDYGENGLREGQPKVRNGSASMSRGRGVKLGDDHEPGVVRPVKGATGWPLPKSLALIPEAYRMALAYGRNPHNGRQTDPWRIRNVIRWVRPNPPVGALGDKFRPATSEMVVACKSATRWFDLDAVRVPHDPNHARQKSGRIDNLATANRDPSRNEAGADFYNTGNPAGAPPLDWWKISPKGYDGAHYATWPPELCVRPIEAMCPRRVCLTCGKPSRRLEGDLWTDCSCFRLHCAGCNVLVPYERALQRSGEGPSRQEAQCEEAVLVRPGDRPTAGAEDGWVVRVVRPALPRAGRAAVLQSQLFGESEPYGGETSHTLAAVQGRQTQACEGLLPGLGANGNAWSAEQRLHDGTPLRDDGAPGPGDPANGGRAPHQRRPGGQPGRELDGATEAGTPEAARRALAVADTGGFRCQCGATDLRVTRDIRPGIVLDPFGGSGTTASVATGHGRDCISVDLDKRNADLARERIGMFLQETTAAELSVILKESS